MHLLNADLHSHSTVSDGTLSPEAVAARAHANGVALWSLTDHDEVGGQARARDAALALGMDYLTGVEISVTFAGETVHIVGLGFDAEHPAIMQGLADTRGGRERRAREMAEGLARMIFGAEHRRLLPAAALVGAIYLTLVDVLCRTLFAPSEIPIGVVTAMLGTPYFIWLIRRRGGMALGEAS